MKIFNTITRGLSSLAGLAVAAIGIAIFVEDVILKQKLNAHRLGSNGKSFDATKYKHKWYTHSPETLRASYLKGVKEYAWRLSTQLSYDYEVEDRDFYKVNDIEAIELYVKTYADGQALVENRKQRISDQYVGN